MTTLLDIQRCPAEGFAAEDYVIFGGTFDPFHQGHAAVVRALAGLFRTVVVAPTEANPWKAERPSPLALRREMIRLVLEHEGMRATIGGINEVQVPAEGAAPSEPRIVITEIPYVYAEELVREFRRTLRGTLYWAVGEDSAEQVHLWRNWESLGVASIVHPVVEQIHAADIRSGRKQLHPALVELAQAHHLYGY